MKSGVSQAAVQDDFWGDAFTGKAGRLVLNFVKKILKLANTANWLAVKTTGNGRTFAESRNAG